MPSANLPGYPATAPPLQGPVTFDQRWRELTFVHWPVRPDSVRNLYPAGTRPDVFADGMTYVGLVPFANEQHQSWFRTSASVFRRLPGD